MHSSRQGGTAAGLHSQQDPGQGEQSHRLPFSMLATGGGAALPLAMPL